MHPGPDEQEEEIQERQVQDNASKLQFSNKLYGRDQEIHCLWKFYEIISSSRHHPLVGGEGNGNGNEEHVIYGETSESSMASTASTNHASPGKRRNYNSHLVSDANGALNQHKHKNKHTDTPSFVLITGKSGTGKSALMHKLVEKINSNQERGGCYYLNGKFDLGQQPFSGIAEAFDGFCAQILQGDEDERVLLTASIQRAISNRSQVLTHVIPNLGSLLNHNNSVETTTTTITTNTTSTPSTTNHTDEEWNRLTYVFKQFVQAIGSPIRPVILFLDDLQWIDDPSLDLLMDLMQDPPTQKHLLLVGALTTDGSTAASDTTMTSHPLLQRLENVKNTRIERMELENLPFESIQQFLAECLRLSIEEVTPLADGVYSQTKGNISYTRQSLEHLQRHNALYLSSTSNPRWTWDTNKIESGSPEDLNCMITAKIDLLPETLRTALTLAAHIRATFDVDTLFDLMVSEGHQFSAPVNDADNLFELLETAVYEGLLRNSMGSRDFKFIDCRIQKACSNRIGPPGASRDAFRQRIGKFLLARGHSLIEGEDWMFFVAADHLNALPLTQSEMDPLDLARLNLKVGEKAVLKSAFGPASKYLRQGLDILDKNPNARPWQMYYDLTLRLYRTAADVEFCLGNFDLGKELCLAIIQNSNSLHDKLRVQLSLANALGRQERHAEAMEVHKAALYSIQEFPKNFHFVHILKDVRKIKKLFQQNTDYDIMLLPVMTDEEKIVAMEHLTKFCLRAFHCNKLPVVLLCILRQLRMSFKFGVSPESAEALASYGMILCGQFGDAQSGARMARISRLMLETIFKDSDKTKAQSKMSHVLFTNAVYIDAWSKPLPEVLESLQIAYSRGMESGDIENAFRSWASSNVHAYAAGFPLDHVTHDGTNLKARMNQYAVDSVRVAYEPFQYAVRHLMGAGKSPIDWKSLDSAPSPGNAVSETCRWIWVYWSRLQLAYYFGELEIAEKILGPFRELSSIDTSYIITSIQVFFCGLTNSALARRTGKSKYRKAAKKGAEEMKKITRTRGLNSLHKHLIMEADIFAGAEQKNNPRAVKDKFDKAIAEAEKAAVIQDAALANELAGEYFLSIKEDNQASQYFTQALALYKGWGAREKAKHLILHRGHWIAMGTTDSLKSSLFFTPPSVDSFIVEASEPFNYTSSNKMIESMAFDDTSCRRRNSDQLSTAMSEVTTPSCFISSTPTSSYRPERRRSSDPVSFASVVEHSSAEECNTSAEGGFVTSRLHAFYPSTKSEQENEETTRTTLTEDTSTRHLDTNQWLIPPNNTTL
jgi:predicted ATPase